MEFCGGCCFSLKIVIIIFQPDGFRVFDAVSQLLFSYIPSEHQYECHKEAFGSLFSSPNNITLRGISIPDFLQDL